MPRPRLLLSFVGLLPLSTTVGAGWRGSGCRIRGGGGFLVVGEGRGQVVEAEVGRDACWVAGVALLLVVVPGMLMSVLVLVLVLVLGAAPVVAGVCTLVCVVSDSPLGVEGASGCCVPIVYIVYIVSLTLTPFGGFLRGCSPIGFHQWLL